jgi:hypothetical protein
MSSIPPPPPPPPTQVPSTTPAGQPLDEVSGPAIGLLITAIFGGLFAFLGLLGNLLGFSLGTMMAESAEEEIAQWVSGGFGITSSALGLLVAGFILYASLEMRKLSQWGLAVGASVVAMIPCVSPCCLIGLPVGIWSLVVLTKPHIKAAFH